MIWLFYTLLGFIFLASVVAAAADWRRARMARNTPPRMLARFGAQRLTVTGPFTNKRWP